MFSKLIPVVLLFATPTFAETLTIPDVNGQSEQAKPMCENRPFSQENCVRVLACIGSDGLWFDGAARGWDQGIVTGATNLGVPCAGHWKAGGFLGTGTAQIECRDGMTANVLYYMQDNVTGTVIGRGNDSEGRAIRVWSGENVLKYLTPESKPSAELPCSDVPIPIS